VELRIPAVELERLHAHAREGHPYEVVGILAGDRASGRVRRVVPLVNERADSPRNRYVVSGLVLHRAEEALVAEGLEVVGYYHSHPDHPALYSDFDRDHALPNMAYLITSVELHDGALRIADTRVWLLREDRSAMDELPLLPVEDTRP
jgi:proteasome lid subunit RPN8/RPN11